MKYFLFCLLVLSTLVRAQTTQPSGPPASARPNIVLIMADDLGFSDLGSYGGEIKTPNLDALAQTGVKFASFYNTPRCCPTRASMLTGVYPHQAGVGAMNQDLGKPGYEGHLNSQVATIAEVLKQNGYATGMVGKWHLSNLTISTPGVDAKPLLSREKEAPISTPAQQARDWPNARGFERFTGTIPGVNNFFDPYGLVKDGTPFTPPDLKNFYYTNFINDTAAEFVRDFAKQDKPFFLYVAHIAPHWPLHAKPADIAKYRDVYNNGWQPLREARFKRLRELGLIDEKWPLSPRHDRRANSDQPVTWADVTNKAWETERMATYAAQVDALDQGIGRLIETLRATNRLDNTVVIFLSDNGACAEAVQVGWYDVQTRTRDGQPIRVGNSDRVTPGPETTWLSYGPMWANVSNTPFRNFKHDLNEGGISTPMIFSWPAGLAARGIAGGGAVIQGVGHVMDFAPTFYDIAGVTYPAQRAGVALLPLEGRSLMPLIARQPQPDRTLCWEHEGARGVRVGNWKLISAHNGPWELYDLEADRTELKDQAAVRPEIVARLKAEYDAWTKRAGVQPWPIRQ